MGSDRSRAPEGLLPSLRGAEAGARAMECLDDATLDGFLSGRLPAATLSAVDAHLDGCARCSALVSALVSAESSRDASVASGERAIPRELARGALIGRYTVLESIGRGAMGVVYAAYDPKLDRRVALKLLRPDAPDDARARVHARMLREAQAMARLAHPNVVAIFEAGEHENGVFLAMELVAGRTLREWLAAAPRAWREVRDVMVQAGEGLAAAHARGIVHRDFKPENVIVGDDGRVRVTDFGLARTGATALDAAIAEQDRAANPSEGAHTATGALLGTPAYMAPEQIDRQEVDALSDQFAFCVTCFEALYGERPYGGATLGELRGAMARGEVRAPAARKGAAVPSWLDRAVRRGIAEKPAARHASMRALITALRADEGRTSTRRTIAGALVLTAITAGAALAAVRSRAVRDPCGGGAREVAQVWDAARGARVREAFAATGAPFARESAGGVVATLDRLAGRWADAHAQTCRATWVRGEQSQSLLDARMHCLRRRLADVASLVERFEHADPSVVRNAGDAVEEVAPLEACAEVATLAALPERPRDPARARALTEVERLLGELRADVAAGRYEPSLPTARSLAARAHEAGYGPAEAEARLLLARLLRRSGALREAATEARHAVFAAESSRDDRAAVRAWLELLAAHGELGAWDEVETLGQHAAASLARLGDAPALAASLDHLLGNARYNTGRFDEAERLLESARARREALGARADLARTLSSLGNVARARGRFERALELHERALASDRGRLGGEHPDLARHQHNVAGVLRRMGRTDEARRAYGEALRLETAGAGAQSPAVGLTRNSLGTLALEAGDLAGAERELSEALRVLTLAMHPERALVLQNLGVLLARRGEHEAALVRFEGALAIERARAAGAPNERVARVLKSRGYSLARVGRFDDAEGSLREACAIARSRAAVSEEAATIAREADEYLEEVARLRASASVATAPVEPSRVAEPRVARGRLESPRRAEPGFSASETPSATPGETAATTQPPVATTSPAPSPAAALAPEARAPQPANVGGAVVPAVAPATQPARPAGAPRPGSSTSYGAAQSWDPD